jgi:alpha-tubulin suppressor-like RCC1 family protein
VTGLTGAVTMVAAGAAHTLVLKADGTVWAFGANTSGQLGFNSTASQSLTPVQVVGITGTVVGIAGGTTTRSPGRATASSMPSGPMGTANSV